jgi:membrane protease subunit HflK
LSGDGIGGVLAWSGAVVLLRLGPSVLLGGAAQGAARWVLAGLALITLAGVLLRGGWQDPGLSVIAIFVIVALWVDVELARREAEADRDAQPLLQLALGLVVVGQAVSALGHPAGAWLITGAAGALCLSAWAVLASCFGASPERYDGVVRLLTPGRLVVAGIVLFFAGGFHVVPPGHQALVERFGSPQADPLEAGLALRLPPPIERIERVDIESVRRVQIIQSGTTLLCGDQSMVSLGVVLHYSVSDPVGFAYGALDARELVQQVGRAAVVASIGRNSQDSVLTSGRPHIEKEVAGAVQAILDRLHIGVAVSSVRLINVSVPAPALASFLDVISADEERRTTVNLAEAYAVKVIPEALGMAVSHHEAAEVYAYERAIAAEVGDLRFRALVEGAQSGRSVTKTRLRFESLERSLSDQRVVVAPEDVRVWIGGQGTQFEGTQGRKALAKERSQ